MRTLLLAAVALGCASRLTAGDDPFAFKDGDRVVLLGSTLIEREQKYGYWELALTLHNKDKAVTFRNLGWSGDTVWGEARNGFDNSPKGFERMVTLTKELKPTVVVVCYGQNESFDGKAGVGKFTAGLEKLLDSIADTKARVVLMSPTPFEKGPGLADPDALNAALVPYRGVVSEVAEKRALEFVDLLGRVGVRHGLRDRPTGATDNGLHLTAVGYEETASLLTATYQSPDQLAAWKARCVTSDAEKLRAKIVEKNRLFFYRWRPQNETYLFGFRKHEQGRNAAEVAQFDPLVADAEKRIAELKKAVK